MAAEEQRRRWVLMGGSHKNEVKDVYLY
jgi:hypothetical protein